MKRINIVGFALSAYFMTMFSATFAQSIDKNEVTFDYIQLPLTPLDNKVKSYDVVVIQNAEAKNVEIKAAYEQKKADADKKYEMDLKAQEDLRNSQKSGVGSFLVAAGQMDPKNKVVKEPVADPVYIKVFPTESVSSKINIEGFTKSTSNAAIVTVTLVGFEATEPVYKSSGTDPNISWTYSLEYKSPINVKVECDGKVYMDEIIPNSNKTMEFKQSNAFKTEADARLDWTSKSSSIKDGLQTKAFDASIVEANKFVNNKFGFMKMKREALLFSVTSKKVDYTDYNEAFTVLNEGLLMLGEDMLIEEGKTKIKEGVAKFETILKESDVKDKKARINEDVTIATYLNLLEANLWLNDFIACQKLILKIKTSNTSNREEKRMNRIKELIDDQKLRYDANKI
jgi:hypothetical protein